MKKIPVTESENVKKAEKGTKSDEAKERSTLPANNQATVAPQVEQGEAEDEVARLQADLDRFRDLAMRSQADFENYKKRCAREKDEAIKYANRGLLERLVTIVDNFELGLEAARDESEKSPIYSGMTLVLKQLQDFLAENGLQPIEAVGQKFDPSLHEAIAHEPSDEVPEEVVIRQIRRGYRFRDRLLRPSSVVVSSGPAKKVTTDE